MIYVARKANGFRLYWLDAPDEATGWAMIAAVDALRPDAARNAFQAASLTPITGDEFDQLPRVFKACHLKWPKPDPDSPRHPS